jgi:hypothetical protein
MSECGSCMRAAQGCGEGCPVCGSNGIAVPSETVRSLVKAKPVLDDVVYKICTTPGCDVSYYGCGGDHFLLSDVAVPIWFKRRNQRYMICYCKDIDLFQIMEAVDDLDGSSDKETILKHLGKSHGYEEDCLRMNPLGISCERLFQNAIEYANKKRAENKTKD